MVITTQRHCNAIWVKGGNVYRSLEIMPGEIIYIYIYIHTHTHIYKSLGIVHSGVTEIH